MSKSLPAIEVVGLRKVYSVGSVRVPALRGVTFTVEKGKFVSIVGPSGCGKSTLLNMIGAL
ncbi:MAG: ATP-binding cassette domain-containing protein, partial [Candidatus Bathyarchaeia archaeon]